MFNCLMLYNANMYIATPFFLTVPTLHTALVCALISERHFWDCFHSNWLFPFLDYISTMDFSHHMCIIRVFYRISFFLSYLIFLRFMNIVRENPNFVTPWAILHVLFLLHTVKPSDLRSQWMQNYLYLSLGVSEYVDYGGFVLILHRIPNTVTIFYTHNWHERYRTGRSKGPRRLWL